MVPPHISNKTRILEIAGVIATAIGKFIVMDFAEWRFPFIATVTIFWVSYIIYRGKTNTGIIHYWGFRTDNFKTVLKKVLPFGLLSIIAFICIGLYQDTINITWHIIPILILYPVWGVIQQYLLIALTAGNMQHLKGQRVTNGVIIICAALFFGAIHYPYIWLIAGTFVLALFYGWIYLQERNIYVLGLFHGWLGALFYYTVVGRDPFVDIFGKLAGATK
jgi:membrane protease YdiL (CAAX protease family)